jgi:hypothetical protein
MCCFLRREPREPRFGVRARHDAELADILDKMGNPDAITLIRITDAATGEIQAWLRDRKIGAPYHTASKNAATFQFAMTPPKAAFG